MFRLAFSGNAGQWGVKETIAIRSGMRPTDLKHMVFAYPTSGSNMTRLL
jgi:hypothetical protein